MCNCADSHIGIECQGKGCHCHDEVYMSISILNVPMELTSKITKAVMAAADTSEISISFSTPAED